MESWDATRVDPVTISTWLIKQLAGYASKRAQLKLSQIVFGDPLQRALRNPTKTALIVAVDGVLGENASRDDRQRAFDIMQTFWTSDLSVSRASSTFTEAMQEIVAGAINRANAPVVGLPEEYGTVTTLTSLSDELGIRIDGDDFAAKFVSAWYVAVQSEAMSNAVLHPFAEVLEHERTQAQAAANHAWMQAAILGFEERLNETLRAAVQSAYEQGAREGTQTIAGRLQWFEMHVAPADRLMHEIHDDYRSGFRSTLVALRSGVDLEKAMRRLEALRDRKITGRRGVLIIARGLLENRPDGVFGASLTDPLIAYLEAVQGFQRADAELSTTWYSDYIEKFSKLLDRGEDPHLRSNYSEISVVNDLKGQLAVAIDFVLNTAIPKKWDEYVTAYDRLRNACIAYPS